MSFLDSSKAQLNAAHLTAIIFRVQGLIAEYVQRLDHEGIKNEVTDGFLVDANQILEKDLQKRCLAPSIAIHHLNNAGDMVDN